MKETEQQRIAAKEKAEQQRLAAVEKGRAAMAKHQTQSLLDPTFRYTNSVETNLQKSFARIEKKLREKKLAEEKVVPIRRQESPK